jgi:hypothetical protein
VAIRYTWGKDGSAVEYLLDGKVVSEVDRVGIPLDRRHGPKYTGIYPSYGPGEELSDRIDSFVIGHGTFSLLDAFPFHWGWNYDPATGWACDTASWAAACGGSVSIPVSERLFGQGVRARFDSFTVTTKAK